MSGRGELTALECNQCGGIHQPGDEPCFALLVRQTREAAAAREALEAADAMAFALGLHNETPSGRTRKCHPECVACSSLARYRAARASDGGR